MRLLYSRETALGAVFWFGGGFELEVRWDGRWWAFWSTAEGDPLGCARWGIA